jgi:hypothetical protein
MSSETSSKLRSIVSKPMTERLVRHDCEGSWQFDPFCLHHTVLPNRRDDTATEKGPFCRDIRCCPPSYSVSADSHRVSAADFDEPSLQQEISVPGG